MPSLFKLEQEAKALDIQLFEAIRSESRELKLAAVDAFENSNLLKERDMFLSYMMEDGPTARKIKLAKDILPSWIETLQGKVNLIKESLGLESPYESDIPSENESVDELSTQHIEEASKHEEKKPAVKTDSNDTLLRLVKDTLQPYLDAMKLRQSEYTYGNIEHYGRYFGASGYSKSEKIDAINNLYKAIEQDNPSFLSRENISVLNQGDLGTKYLSPLLENDQFGPKLKELLTTPAVANSSFLGWV